MRILHTSDWHLGKKLQSKPRLAEQRKVMDELAYICDNGKVDVVLVAGDIFDTSVPPAEAEELFYESALRLADNRVFIAVAGNHDDPDRLSAPHGIARNCNIFLSGSADNSSLCASGRRGVEVTGGFGSLRIKRAEQTLNLALLPYPSYGRIKELGDADGETFEEKVKAVISRAASVFTQGGINIFCSHLFINGSEACDNELGGAQALGKNVLPDAVYSALGHIHKPQTASRGKNAYYSGSILGYSFDDLSKKRCIIVDTDGTDTKIEEVPLNAGRKLLRLRCETIAEAFSALENSDGAFVELTYAGGEPLKPSDIVKLRAFDGFCKLNVETRFVKKEAVNRKDRTAAQLFKDYFEKNYGKEPDESVVELFIKIISGEDVLS